MGSTHATRRGRGGHQRAHLAPGSDPTSVDRRHANGVHGPQLDGSHDRENLSALATVHVPTETRILGRLRPTHGAHGATDVRPIVYSPEP